MAVPPQPSGTVGEKEGGDTGAELTCPFGPGSPDSPCRHKEARSRSGGAPGPPTASLANPTPPAHLLSFLSWEAGHPWVALLMQNHESQRQGGSALGL